MDASRTLGTAEVETIATVTPAFSVRVATVQNGTLASAFDNNSVVDGVTLATNDIILVKNQNTASDNGVYVVQASGAPVRHTSYDTFGELNMANVTVTAGDVNAGSNWLQTATLTSLSDSQTWISGTVQNYVVDDGIDFIQGLGWGGGGGGGGGGGRGTTGSGGGGGGGGGGGAAQHGLFTLPVTPGETLTLILGGGGVRGSGGTSLQRGDLGSDGSITKILRGTTLLAHWLGGAGGGSGGDGDHTLVAQAGNNSVYASGGTAGSAGTGGQGGGGGAGNLPVRASGGEGGTSATAGAAGSYGCGGGGGGAVNGGAATNGGAGGASEFRLTGGAGGTSVSDSGGGGGGAASIGAGGAGGNGGSADGSNGSQGAGGGGGGGSNNSPSRGGSGGHGGDGGLIIYRQTV